MKIDRIKDSRITWSQMYNDQNTEQYQTLSDEVNYAVGRVSLCPFLSSNFPLTEVQSKLYNVSSIDWVCHVSHIFLQYLHGSQSQQVLLSQRGRDCQHDAGDGGEQLHQIRDSQAGHQEQTDRSHPGQSKQYRQR